ncbi:MAG TPA: hypothetical protein VHN82_05430 [Methanoregula sp.]|nr:hypothetical protein [Methanoregula sp.]
MAVRAGIVVMLLLLIAPFVSATVDPDTIPRSTAPDHADRPEAILLEKTHIAYVACDQDTRMNGIIRYIEIISNGNGAYRLRQIRDDYLVTASSIPLMQSSAEIGTARDSLGASAREFSEEMQAQMLLFNGSTTRMQDCISSMANASAVRNAGSPDHGLWLKNESSRLMLFNRESTDRKRIIAELGKQGANTTRIRNISLLIDAQRPNIQGALMNKSSDALQSTNVVIKDLNREFRRTVADTRVSLAITMKRDAIMAMK